MLELEILMLNHMHRVMTNTEDVHGLKVTIDSEIGVAAGGLKILRLDASGNVTTSGSLKFNSNIVITGTLAVQGGLIQDDTGEEDFQIVTNGGMVVMLDKNNNGTTSKFQVRTNNDGTNLFEIDENGNVTILGNIDVKGTKSYFNTTDTQIKDNLITLNQGETGNGVTLQYAGIEIDRGTLPKAVFRFNESNDKWEWSIDSSAYKAVSDDALVVHLAGAENVTGIKTFSDGQIFDTFNLNSAKYRSDNTGLWLQRTHATQGTIGLNWDNANARFGFAFNAIDKATFDSNGLGRMSAIKLYGAAAKVSAEDVNASLTLEANGTGKLLLQAGSSGNIDAYAGKFILTSGGLLTVASDVQSNTGTFKNNKGESVVLNSGATLSAKGGVTIIMDSDTNTPGAVFALRAGGISGDLINVDRNGTVQTSGNILIKTGKNAETIRLGGDDTASYVTGDRSATIYLNGWNRQHAVITYQPFDKLVTLTGSSGALGDVTIDLLINGKLTTESDLIVKSGSISGKTGSSMKLHGDTGLTLASNQDVVVMLDENSNDTNRYFRIRTNNAATDLFTVDEAGNAYIKGNLNQTASMTIDLKNAADTTLTITNSNGGGKVAHLDVSGQGTFRGGVLTILSSNAQAILKFDNSKGGGIEGAIGFNNDDFIITAPSVTSGGTQIAGLGKQLLIIDLANGDANLTAGGTYKVAGDPVTTKGMMKRSTQTIAAAGTAVTWNHNHGSMAYTVAIASTSVARHVAYRNKTANSIEFFIDDPDVASIDIDVILMGF